ncbi:MAG: hypothetical protein OEL20_04960 [Sulfuritalea sp.]|nr:hypothetical protein [Sulfuritalea sp.]
MTKIHIEAGTGAACSNCRHFSPGIPESRWHPEDPADCGHPRLYAWLSANKHFPFAKGCKHWVARHPSSQEPEAGHG